MSETHKVTVNVSQMTPVGVRPTLWKYVKQLWKLRHFIAAESRGQAFAKTRGTVLGYVWLVVEPFFNTAIYLVMFGLILNTSRGIDNFFGYLMVGSIVFTFTSSSFGQAGTIMQSGAALLKSFTFPRAVLVASFMMRNTINVLPTYAVLLAAIMILPTHALPSIYWVGIIPVFIVQLFFNSGLSFLVASLTARIPDLKFVWPLLSSFWFFTSGIFFSVQRFISSPIIAAVMEANPAYTMLTIYRDVLLYHNFSTWENWAYFGTWAIATFFIGFIMFWRNEEKYGGANVR